MLDLTGLPALDLALGMAFIYFLLALLATTLHELIAALLGLRARTLEQGLRSMLEDETIGWKYVDRFYDHPLIKSLYRTPPPAALTGNDSTPDEDATGRHADVATRNPLQRAAAFFWRTKGPSYISPRAFATILLDNFAPQPGDATIFDQARAITGELPDTLAGRVKPLVDEAQQSTERLRLSLEAWFDDTMARVSGWYKRKSQIIVLVIGVGLVAALNANSFTIAERIWKDDAVRTAVVAKAGELASATPTATPTPVPGQEISVATQQLSQAAADVDDVIQIGIPLGWDGEDWPHGFWLGLLGWLVTILAISLGAPFWFDTLGRLSRIRSSGKPETPLPPTGSGKTNERILTPPQQPTAAARDH